MHSATIFFALAAVAAASASPPAVGVVNDVHAYPAYRYNYGVADKLTGDQKSASEVRDGGVTRGSYSLVQPDGVLRTVNYIVTPLGGFQAQVTRRGVAGHPAVYGVGKGIGAVAAPGLAAGGFGLAGAGLGYGAGLGGLGGGLRGGLGLGGYGGGLGGYGGLGGAGIIG